MAAITPVDNFKEAIRSHIPQNGVGPIEKKVFQNILNALTTTEGVTAVNAVTEISNAITSLEKSLEGTNAQLKEERGNIKKLNDTLVEKAGINIWWTSGVVTLVILLIITISIIAWLSFKLSKKEQTNDSFSPSQIMANGNQTTRGKSWAETLPKEILNNQKMVASNVWRPYLSGSPTLIKAAPLSMNKVA